MALKNGPHDHGVHGGFGIALGPKHPVDDHRHQKKNSAQIPNLHVAGNGRQELSRRTQGREEQILSQQADT